MADVECAKAVEALVAQAAGGNGTTGPVKSAALFLLQKLEPSVRADTVNRDLLGKCGRGGRSCLHGAASFKTFFFFFFKQGKKKKKKRALFFFCFFSAVHSLTRSLFCRNTVASWTSLLVSLPLRLRWLLLLRFLSICFFKLQT